MIIKALKAGIPVKNNAYLINLLVVEYYVLQRIIMGACSVNIQKEAEDLLKERGVFIMQKLGCKYTIEREKEILKKYEWYQIQEYE